MFAVYILLSAVGLIGTWVFNIRSFGTPGENYLGSWFGTNASSSAAVDIIVVAVAASLFMIVEGRRIGMRGAWLFVVLSFVVAAAFAFPLFLALRHRRLAVTSTQRTSAVAA
jgi:Terpene cyclase DEP1